MRSDFSTGFISGKNRNSNAPALLLKLEWQPGPSTAALILRLADRAVSTGSESWQPLVQSWSKSGTGKAGSLSLWNGVSNPAAGAERFTDLFPQYPPELALVTLYQWFEDEGLDESDLAPLFAGVIDDGVEFDTQDCHLKLVPFSESLGQRVVGAPVTTNEFPNVPDFVLGKTKPIVLGAVKAVPGLRVRAVKSTLLTSVVLPGGDTLSVATTEGFPESGLLLVNDDEVSYSGRTLNQFTGCSGITEFHYADDEVLEKVSDHRFLFSDPLYPIKAINRVCIGDQPVNPSEYTVDLVRGEVVFPEQPRKVRSIDTKFLQAQFDDVGAGNTALDPEFAMQPNLRSRYAKINQTYPKLHLKQSDILASPGQIGRVLLRVEHFMEERLSSDSIPVRISGIGQIGTLSPPAADDLAMTSGSTDITHNHLDTFGFPIDIPQPPILPTSDADHVVEQGALSGTGRYQNLIAGQSFVTITFPPAPAGAIRGEYQLNLNVEGGLFGFGEAALYFHGQRVAKWNPTRANFDYTPSFTLTGSSQPGSMTLAVAAQGGQWTVSFTSVKRLLFYPHATQASQQAQQTLKTGSNTEASLQPALTAVTEKSTRTVVDFFDITDEVAGDWSWFSGREIEVEYTGVNDGRTAFILHTAFEIEYARRRLRATDEITADVEGVVDDPEGSVTGVPGLLVERPEHVFLWSLKNLLKLPDSSMDLNSFANSGSRFLSAVPGGYRLAGVVLNQQTLTTLWDKWMVSSRSRLIWDKAGRARLLFSPLNSSSGLSGQEVKTLEDKGVLLHPETGKARVRLLRGSNPISTSLNLPYERNWSIRERTGRYRKLLRVADTVQSDLFGAREHPDGQPLDWCADDAMATDLADFYLARQSRPVTFLECDVSLEHLDLEAGDIVKLNHPDAGFSNVLAELKSARDLTGEHTPDGLQSIRLLFRLFPVEFLQETGLSSVSPGESGFFLNEWFEGKAESSEVEEVQYFSHYPGNVLDSIQGGESFLSHDFLFESNYIQIEEDVFQSLELEALENDANVIESAFSSTPGGWGNQAWGFSGWGGREVLM